MPDNLGTDLDELFAERRQRPMADRTGGRGGRTGNDPDPLIVVRHKPVPEDIPKPPSAHADVSGPNGAS